MCLYLSISVNYFTDGHGGAHKKNCRQGQKITEKAMDEADKGVFVSANITELLQVWWISRQKKGKNPLKKISCVRMCDLSSQIYRLWELSWTIHTNCDQIVYAAIAASAIF